jgi:hypothetical protein
VDKSLDKDKDAQTLTDILEATVLRFTVDGEAFSIPAAAENAAARSRAAPCVRPHVGRPEVKALEDGLATPNAALQGGLPTHQEDTC